MPYIQKTLLLFTLLFFIACNMETKEPSEPKRVLLEGNASEENYRVAQQYFLEGEYEKALAFDLKQLEEDLKYHPNESLEIALDYNNIALDYDKLKQHKKALAFYLKTMKIDEKLLEKNSTERATTYFNVASTYEALKAYDSAITYYRKALAIDEMALEVNHKHLLAEYESLARLYEKSSKPNLALKFWKKTLAYKENTYGKYDLDSNETRAKVRALQKQLKRKVI